MLVISGHIDTHAQSMVNDDIVVDLSLFTVQAVESSLKGRKGYGSVGFNVGG
jgi:hypothetical protein